jgi:uncharacterized RDD family membrane protein YckC
VEYGDRLEITTPEGVRLDLLLAGLGSRFMAAVVDLCLQSLIALAGGLLIYSTTDGGIRTLLFSLGAFLLLFAYDVSFEVLAAGRTPGKRWNGLRVVRETGAPITFSTSAIRNVLRLVDILPVFYGVGMISIFFSRHNQRLGDLAAGTVIARERTGGDRRPAPVVPAGPPLADRQVFGWDTSAITAADLATVRSFLERRATLTPGARAQLAQTLADRLRAKVAGAPVLEPEPFLEELLAQRD